MIYYLFNWIQHSSLMLEKFNMNEKTPQVFFQRSLIENEGWLNAQINSCMKTLPWFDMGQCHGSATNILGNETNIEITERNELLHNESKTSGCV